MARGGFGALTIAERLSRPDIATQCALLSGQLPSLPKPESQFVVGELDARLLPAPVEPKPPLSWADIVFEKDGVPMADSRKVAEVFEKDHDYVLKRIRHLGTSLSSELADEGVRWTAVNFDASSYSAPTGRSLPCFHMTRDGFSLLAMGFTGKRALEFKLGFIQAFNAMEDELLQQQRTSRPDHRAELAHTLGQIKTRSGDPDRPDQLRPPSPFEGDHQNYPSPRGCELPLTLGGNRLGDHVDDDLLGDDDGGSSDLHLQRP